MLLYDGVNTTLQKVKSLPTVPSSNQPLGHAFHVARPLWEISPCPVAVTSVTNAGHRCNELGDHSYPRNKLNRQFESTKALFTNDK